ASRAGGEPDRDADRPPAAGAHDPALARRAGPAVRVLPAADTALARAGDGAWACAAAAGQGAPARVRHRAPHRAPVAAASAIVEPDASPNVNPAANESAQP